MIYKIYFVASFIITFFSTSYAYSFSNAITKIIEKGYLAVGVCVIEQPPFYYKNKKGELEGHDIDLAKNIAEEIGVPLKIINESSDWDQLTDLLLSKKVDLVISFFSKTPKRAQSINFSKTYARINQSLLINRMSLAQAKAKGLKTLQQIFSDPSYKLVVYKGSSYEIFAKRLFPKAHLVTMVLQEEMVKSIISRENTALYLDEIEISNILDKYPEYRLQLIEIKLKDEFDPIAIGISFENHALLSFINTFLEVNHKELNLEDIQNQLKKKKE